MSRYGYLCCEDCETLLWLGKRIRRTDGSTERFQIGDGDLPNAANEQLNRVLWKFLADHADHRSRVFTESAVGTEELDRLLGFAEITPTPETEGDVGFADYLRDWPG